MQRTLSAFIAMILLLTVLYSCGGAKKRYCTYVLRSNRCDISKDIKNLCFECAGNGCPDITEKQVYLKKGEKDSCLVSIGNKLSDCGKCEEGYSIVVLGSILQE